MKNGRYPLPDPDEQVTVVQYRVAVGSLIASLILTATLLILVLTGVSDPRPVGDQIWVDDFKSNTGWMTRNTRNVSDKPITPSELSPSPNTLILVQSPHQLKPPGSLVLLCHQESGAPDAGYGLWITTGDTSPLVIAISSDGYLGIFEPPPSTVEPIRPFRIFPHVKKLGQSNKFQLDFNENKLTIWLNDERAAQFDYSGQAALSIGLYVETYDQSAVFKFERLEGWQK